MVDRSRVRLDADLVASARLAGEVRGWSASRQIAHWARIGREVEASRLISQARIAEVLAGDRAYDSLEPLEQAVVRAAWAAAMAERREGLNLAAEFAAAGRVRVGPEPGAWFWAEYWQQMETQADADIKAGRVEAFDDVETLLTDLGD